MVVLCVPGVVMCTSYFLEKSACKLMTTSARGLCVEEGQSWQTPTDTDTNACTDTQTHGQYRHIETQMHTHRCVNRHPTFLISIVHLVHFCVQVSYPSVYHLPRSFSWMLPRRRSALYCWLSGKEEKPPCPSPRIWSISHPRASLCAQRTHDPQEIHCSQQVFE